jgi:hypothetical protein
MGLLYYIEPKKPENPVIPAPILFIPSSTVLASINKKNLKYIIT